ncbi:MerR family transcriptional regulator [Streptomyces sp. NPDC050161]|uniref:MerR family transcriptional regulator n=1 Tax=Streptomyces sp. NPDC050161 TaxID=3365604 RepID=UPI003797C45D
MKEMAHRAGVHERSLRYYEKQGLLAPERLPSGYREYSEADLETVRRIRCLLTAGLSTAVIAQVLPCIRDDSGQLAPTCPDLIGQLRGERERMTREIEALNTSRALLDTVLDAAPHDLARQAMNTSPE